MKMKRCSQCGELLPLIEGFRRDAKRADGRHSICRACDKRLRKEREANRPTEEQLRADAVAAIPAHERDAAGDLYGAHAALYVEARKAWETVIVRGRRGGLLWVEFTEPLRCNNVVEFADGRLEVSGEFQSSREFCALVRETALALIQEAA